MRIVSLVFSFLVTVSLTAMALTYLPRYVGQQRIHVQGRLASTNPDTARSISAEWDPYHQRYYSESEGWTYYTLPSYSAR
jgi:hypothetical protein